MLMYTSHEKGVLGELAFISHLIEKGYSVLTPVNPNSSYDLVIEKENSFIRVQVKYCTPKNGRIRVELRRPKRKTAPYRLRNVDAMGVYDSINKRFYLVPMEVISEKTEMWLRVEPPRNFQEKKINLAVEYEI